MSMQCSIISTISVFSCFKIIFLVFLVSNSSAKKVAVVTGGNKGLGLAIVQSLCEKFKGDVYLTARVAERGEAALGYHPKFHVLDITVRESIVNLRDHLVQLHGGIDVLINNAGAHFQVDAQEPFAYQASETIRVNYFGFRLTSEILFPILKPYARVVNISSERGHLSMIPAAHLRDILASPDLTESKISELMESYVKAVESGCHIQEGWPDPYTVSKVGVSALSRVQQRELLKDKNRPGILVNHVHPGHARTDVTSERGAPLSIEQRAEAPVYLALLPEDSTEPRGDYVWHTKNIVDWVNGPLPSKEV